MKTIPAAAGVLADPALVGTDLAEAYTAEIDAWLRSVIDDVGDVPGFALAAVGGYGRGDLSPGSDLDLLLIHQYEGSAAEVAERIWYPIWDSGMKLGHAVRTIDEALDLAGDDLDTATSLLEMRYLGGSEALVDELSRKALAQWRSGRDRMLDMLAARIRERHVEAGELAFLLEPDLKLSQGGLRDLHSVRWIDLADHELLDPSERAALAGPHDILLSARIELHRSTGRANNQLLLQEQDEVAAALGYGDADDLMAAVAGAARTVSWIQDSVLHRIHQRGRRRRWLKKSRDLGHGIQLVDDTLSLAPDAAVDDPIMPLRVAVHAARHDAFIERDVLERIEVEGTHLPDPWPDEARELFVDLLLCGHEMIRVVEALDHFDLVTRLIPEWAPNRNRPQRNAYHRFTVDRHLLEAAAEAARLVDRVERPDLLVLGGIFHDIGKGYPGDHSEVGVGLVNTIASRMGYPSDDIEALEALVRHHLLLPDVASRRDLEDEGTVKLVADAVGSIGTVELLAALTEADSIATSKSAWGGWKAELVGELADRTIKYLQGEHDLGGADFPNAEQLELAAAGETVVRIDGHVIIAVTPDRPGVFSRVAGALALHGVEILGANLATADGMAIDRIRVAGGHGLNDRPDEVIADIERALRRELAITARLLRRAQTYRFQRTTSARIVEPAVVVDNEISATSTVLEVRGPDSIGFLYRVTRAFVELDLDIAWATVQTLGADVVDTFYVRGPNGAKVTDPAYLAEIELAVLSAIGADA
ncbi:MAG: [protein-PII] uridylyltransferase [Actinomycetota bacterium]